MPTFPSPGGPPHADPYGADVLSRDPHAPQREVSRPVPAAPGTVVEEVTTGWVGAVVRTERSGGMHVVVLEDRHGRTRTFPLGPGFWIEGRPVILTPPQATARPAAPRLTASGSVRAPEHRARVARASRIWVEGRHDAELVEKVWGEDLRDVGVVVEYLEGIDNLPERVADFGPGPTRRLGVLADHLVTGTKETRIARTVTGGPGGAHVLVVGHPFVDVWQAVRPERVGLDRWPQIPRHVEWKIGALTALGLPHADQSDVARGWRAILDRVRTYRDLEPALTGRVEELIDFVTVGTPG